MVTAFIFGISCERDSLIGDLQSAEEQIQTAIEDSLFAGAVLLVGNSDEILYTGSFGFAHRYNSDLSEVEHPEPMSEDYLFDLASLSKVLATTYGIMILHSQGQIQTDDRASKYIPQFDTPEKSEITIEHLLRHISGLRPWFPTYYVASTAEERLEFIADESLIESIGQQRNYSDLGFMVLADIIKDVSGKTLDQFLADELYKPLDLSYTGFNPDQNSNQRLVSTSHGNPFEKKMVHDDDFGYHIDIDPHSWDDWRIYTLRGEVNDGNAFHTHDGIAGHAGLFSTASEIYTLLSLMLNGGSYQDTRIFSEATISHFLSEDDFGHGMGWMKTESSLHAKDLPEGSFGHTGFTGTNIIVSPSTDKIMVFLTNRQHVGVDEEGNYPNLRTIRETLSSILLQ